MYDNSLIHHLGQDRPSIFSSYAQKCSHGHMYLVLVTFGWSKSPNRLSCRWIRIVRQLSDTPHRARSAVKFLFIRMKMFPRTHVPRACYLPPCEIVYSTKWRLEATCTTTLRYTTSDTIDRQIPLHTHENVPTDTCTSCSKPSVVRNSVLD